MSDAKMYFLDPANRRLLPMSSTNYVTEDQLQSYLADYVDLIPGDQIDPESPRRWLLVAREMGVPDMENATGDRWSLDHLFLDQDGMPTFVEVKRAVDTRTRREVVAQMLDYAANGLQYWSMDGLRQAAAESAQRRGTSLDAELLALLGSDNPDRIESFWQQVKENLSTGRVRLLFVVDQAPRELRRLAEFLNEKLTDIQVLIVEIKQYSGAVGIALAPRVLGMTEAARMQKAAPRNSTLMTHEEFFATCPPETAPVMAQLMELASERGFSIAWTPKSWTARIRDPQTRDWRVVLRGWVGPNWDVVVSTHDLGRLDPQIESAVRERLRASDVFPFVGAKDMCSVRPVSAAVAEPLLDAVRFALEAARTLFTVDPGDGTGRDSATTVPA